MKDSQPFDTINQLPVSLAFRTLKSLSDHHLITGTDDWRHPTGSDSLSAIDPQLAQLVAKQPPSKFGYADTPSLWTATHFFLALPTLSYVLKQYGTIDSNTSAMVLSREEISQYFVAFPHIARHYHEYKELSAQFGAPTAGWWQTTLQTAFGQKSDGTPATILLSALPPYLQKKASQVLAGDGDSLSGRIVLAYLLGQGTSSDTLPFDPHTEQYLAPMHSTAPTQTLYERLITAQQEFAELDPYLKNYQAEHSLKLGEFLGLVSWYGRPHLVEMVIPGLTGAAEPAIRSLASLFAHIVQEGGPDYTAPTLSDIPTVQKFRATQSLAEIGRLSIIKDLVTTATESEHADGVLLRRLASQLYGDEDRFTAWGNATYYVPNATRSSFKVFKQDIANILFCAGIFTEHENNMAGTVDSEALKQLARKALRSRTMASLRTAITGHHRILNELAVDWEVRYAGQERLRLLRFILQTFGLDTVDPIAIPLEEVYKGFAESYYDGHVYHLHYREAGEKLEMAITVQPHKVAPVRYHTNKQQSIARLTSDGLPYSAWLEVRQTGHHEYPIVIPVPGRGSFDPFGRVGSVHAGEVIGFGCSVHHASLIVILVELASLGASDGDLQQVTSAFMRINQKVHERYNLAAFQLAQIIAAFHEGRTYTHRDYLQVRQDLIPDSTRPHLSAYARIGKKSLAWAEPQAARLAYGYPKLYPTHSKIRVNPRFSWYDGSDVELPTVIMSWQVLTC